VKNYQTAPSSIDAGECLAPAPGGVSIASFAGFDADGHFRIDIQNSGAPVTALSTIGLGASDIGCRLVVAFENIDYHSPIIIGRLYESAPQADTSITVDDGRVVIRAEREIELRCGDASIVLTRAGKVVTRGNYVISRSRGVNKIKGAAVGIN
jgi:hypothetical protein